jgi:hypothetical protein
MLRALCVATAFTLTSAASAAQTAGASAQSDEAVKVLVLRENGSGSAATAQKFLDGVMDSVSRVTGWNATEGTYHTQRSQALAYIEESRPQFGILSLAAFLNLRKDHGLVPIGKASVKGGGGERYFVVSNTAQSLQQCKGQTLASNHASDRRFVDNIVASGAFKLEDFEVLQTRRPVQTIKKVIRGEAKCALVDDAQLADMSNVEGGSALKQVWSSKPLPGLVIVAFKEATAEQTKTFKNNLSKVCQGEGKSACESAGIQALSPGGTGALKKLTKAY